MANFYLARRPLRALPAPPEYLAYRVSSFLTAETGINVTFESAIVPNWKENSIRLKNVRIARTFEELPAEERAAHERHYAKFDVSVDTLEIKLSFLRLWEGRGLLRECTMKGVRGSIGTGHNTIHSQSKEWHQNAEAHRNGQHRFDGAADRSAIVYDESVSWPRRKAQWGDFDLENVHIEDALFTVMQPKFRPFQVSCFTFEADRLRQVRAGREIS